MRSVYFCCTVEVVRGKHGSNKQWSGKLCIHIAHTGQNGWFQVVYVLLTMWLLCSSLSLPPPPLQGL